ncbi:MAG: helix-turn-helix domain-containing protein [Flavobacteriaceae bacterium]|nr:helix-turn-helix domain-containing protein [Flavobacteriaceae bacterium]
MNTKKPILERISPEFGSSILVRRHENYDYRSEVKPFWHFHPEIELIYVNNGKGKVHIGNHLSYFNNSQLLLIGSNLPHNGFTDRLAINGSQTCVQFKPEFLGNSFFNIPEMAKINNLIERSKMGISFGIKTKRKLGSKIEILAEKKGVKKILVLLDILHALAKSDDYNILNADGFAFEAAPQDSAKVDIIFKHVNNNFKEHISLDEIANKVSMTVPSFCRYFKKVTGKTFTKFVNEYRVVHATKILIESKSSITDVCYECGFNNFSHFNKVFKEITGKSASNYRNEIKQIIQ